MKIRKLVVIILLCILVVPRLIAQDISDPSSPNAARITNQYISAIQDKAAKTSENLDKQTERYLSKLAKQEENLRIKLAKVDSAAAIKVFSKSSTEYQEIQQKVKGKSDALLKKSAKYLPWLDSASTSLKFLQNNPSVSLFSGDAAKLKGAVGKIKDLENQFKQAASVKEFIQERKEYLSEQLKNYNLGGELKKYNETAYYYSQQINDYREALADPIKAERKALELLNKMPAFQNFIQKNSMLASLFAVPGGDGDPSAVAQNMINAQTRSSVQAMVQNQIAAAGPNGQTMFEANMQDAQAAMSSLKNKMQQLSSNGGGDLSMPDFKPNQNKTKSFLKRIEYGASIQSVKSNYFFPVTSDIALSAGYKLWGQNVIGLKASYKIGWGKDISHIAISSEGMGFGSFLDIKLKGSFYASGGFEFNYQKPADSLVRNHNWDINNWSRSGLLGISKIVSLKTKVFKKTKLQLLWDFLSYQQLPRSAPFKFRVGYNF